MTATLGYFTLTSARDGGTRPNPHGGELARHYCNFTGDEDNRQYENVYWAHKPENEPHVGQSYYGEMSHSEQGWRFRRKQVPDDAPASASAPSQAASGVQSGVNTGARGQASQNASQGSDPRQQSIERQTAAKVAGAILNGAGEAAMFNELASNVLEFIQHGPTGAGLPPDPTRVSDPNEPPF